MKTNFYSNFISHLKTGKKIFYLFGFVLIMLLPNISNAQSFPTGFSSPLWKNGWTEVEGFRFDPTGQAYVYEKAGKVWVVDTNGNKITTPLLDIHDEVGGWRDHGLNGFALDPNFRTNGYYYLFYTVDRYHLIYSDSLNYNAARDSFYKATICRVTRYTANPATNFTTTISGSRLILLGEDKKTGVPLLHESHSGGQLVFGTDGSLLVTTGDGASYNYADSGGTVTTGTYWKQALADTIIRLKENVGSFRSQIVDCLNGKVLRLDPATGNGLPSNPYYDPANPRSAKSRVWCLGLRNPFRACLRPGSGSTDITAGNPGALYIGDVGWDAWEDLHIANGPGLNFGWPLFEGLTPHNSYQNIVSQYNLDAPNPLYGVGGCTQQYLKFKDLCIQANLAPSFPNPCNSGQQIPSNILHYVHTRPIVDWSHSSDIARTGTYSGNNATTTNLNSGSSPFPGPLFRGNASVGGTFYNGTKYPVAYQNRYFQSDFGQGWIRTLTLKSNNYPDSMSNFGVSYGAVVFLEYNPKDQFIYYVKYPSEIYKLAYSLSVNNPPTAVASQNILYGTGPLTVNFTGSNSTDPENQPLNYLWNFGDATPNSTSPNPAHLFNATPGIPTTYTVTLTVTDNASQTSTTTLKVYVNNTPPQVNITSFQDGDLYSMAHNTILPLQASVFDAEHSAAQLTYAWQTILHHNNHDHEEAIDNNVSTTTVISPVGCDAPNVYYFRIILKVTDAAGLSTTVENRIYPACNAPVADFSANITSACPGAVINFTDQSANLPEGWTWTFPGGNPSSSTFQNPSVTYASAGTYNVSLTSSNIRGNGSLTKTGYIIINANPAASITPSGTDSVCPGTSMLLTANSGTGLTYQWIKNGADISGALAQTFNATTFGYFKVRVTKTSTGCFKTSNAKIIANRSPNSTVTSDGPTTFCAGDSVVFSVPYVAGNTYQWKKGGNNILGATSATYTAKTGGKYKVTITDQFGCSKTSSNNLVTINCKLAGENNLQGDFTVDIYPNPTNASSTISLFIPSKDRMSIKVFDVLGKQIQEIVNNLNVNEGEYEFALDATSLSPGIYFVLVSTGQQSQTVKLIVNNNN